MAANKIQSNLGGSEFYGFLDELDTATADQIAEHLASDAVSVINEGDTRGQVVEEVISRGGTLYTGAEAKEVVPWVISDSMVCAAKFPYLDGETHKTASGFEEFDWCGLDDIQYMYGKHLQKMIAEGHIAIVKE